MKLTILCDILVVICVVVSQDVLSESPEDNTEGKQVSADVTKVELVRATNSTDKSLLTQDSQKNDKPSDESEHFPQETKTTGEDIAVRKESALEVTAEEKETQKQSDNTEVPLETPSNLFVSENKDKITTTENTGRTNRVGRFNRPVAVLLQEGKYIIDNMNMRILQDIEQARRLLMKHIY